VELIVSKAGAGGGGGTVLWVILIEAELWHWPKLLKFKERRRWTK